VLPKVVALIRVSQYHDVPSKLRPWRGDFPVRMAGFVGSPDVTGVAESCCCRILTTVTGAIAAIVAGQKFD
jgi:hypothetical protein